MDNKQIMAENIKRLMAKKDVSAMDVCRALDIKQPTFSDWTTGKYYPRIDKIEKMAQYFGVDKSELVEPYSKIEKIKELRAQLTILNEEHARLDKQYADIMLDTETQKIFIEIKKLDPSKKQHVIEYLKFLNKENGDEG
jgi:transcriptional regulator with XRE-family HTH domain